ncbi:N-acetylmuramic acid 6-phosphate etherase [Glaciibacter sp. 2TAF33]|uniref:N-acetylmuramic acid 6-phosphate etherase n=1 Tax=Glaciibacter sp. 2TAF33 TaxID=3233015 RepID=UPI003F905EE9
MLSTLSTEQVSTTNTDLDLMSVGQLVAAMSADGATVAEVIIAAEPRIVVAIEGIVGRMRRGGRLIYVGAGTAGRIGILDASEIPPTFGTDPDLVVGVIAGGPDAIHAAQENAEDDAPGGAESLTALALTADDAVVGVSASGRTPFVLGAIEYAKSVGAFTVGFACNADSALGLAADVAIETVVGPEFVAGSTRLKAGTAQKLVLNMISTIVMVRLGKVHGNLMVDLKATNEKLRARSERTVMLATGADAETAARALDEAGGWVKAAIMMTVTGLDADSAQALLTRHGAVLRSALADAGLVQHDVVD